MAEVKPAEISAILREQLAGFKSEAEIKEVVPYSKWVTEFARIYGMNNVQYGELIEFESGVRGIALNLGRRQRRCRIARS